jgi:hypothetical protein
MFHIDVLMTGERELPTGMIYGGRIYNKLHGLYKI